MENAYYEKILRQYIVGFVLQKSIMSRGSIGVSVADKWPT